MKWVIDGSNTSLGSDNVVSTFLNNISLCENIRNQTTLTCGHDTEIQDEVDTNSMYELDYRWMERSVTAYANDVTADVAGSYTID